MRLLQKFIYSLIFRFYKVVVKLSHPEVKDLWFRNSFCFDYWVFLKSDIDITIVFEKISRTLVHEINHTHSIFRRYLPVIGELVIFSEAHKLDILTCVNTYELRRDPQLIKNYNLEKKPDLYEKIIFLHKFISANWSKKNLDHQRPEKLVFIAQHLELQKTLSFEALIDELASMLGVEPIKFRKDYINEQNNRAEKVIYKSFEISNTIYSLFYNNLCYLNPTTELSITEKNTLEKTVLWELWGFFSYQFNLSTKESTDHMNRLMDELDNLTSQKFALEMKNLLKRFELR